MTATKDDIAAVAKEYGLRVMGSLDRDGLGIYRETDGGWEDLAGPLRNRREALAWLRGFHAGRIDLEVKE